MDSQTLSVLDVEKKVFDLFKEHEIYLVGGSVRDTVLGREISDLDFATNCLPVQTAELLSSSGYKTYSVGLAFGTVCSIIDDYEIQITTYRKNESYQRDNRHPVVEWGKTINDDLSRRDFTINCLAKDRDGNIVDLFCGLKHLNEKIIETPIDAKEIFRDDPLRILRAVRFRSKLGYDYSDGVKKALKSQAFRLLILSKERILEELNKILLGDYVKEALNDLLEYRLLSYIVPELSVLNGVEQDSIYHHKNVWFHTVDVVGNTPKDIVLRFSGLFHDIGKPYVKTIDNGVHFYRHEEVSEFMAESILNRLGLPKKQVEKITFLVKNHMKPNLYDRSWSDSAVKRFIRDVGDNLEDLLSLSRADITSHNEMTIASKVEELNDLKNRIEELKNYKEVKSPLSGEDIMAEFNLTPGPEVGKIKNMLIEGLLNGEIELNMDKQIYLDYVRRLRC